MLSKMQKKCSNIPAHNPPSRHTTFFSFFMHMSSLAQWSFNVPLSLLEVHLPPFHMPLYFFYFLILQDLFKYYIFQEAPQDSGSRARALCISIGHLLPHSKYCPLYRLVHTTYTKESFLKTGVAPPLVIAVFLVCRE